MTPSAMLSRTHSPVLTPSQKVGIQTSPNQRATYILLQVAVAVKAFSLSSPAKSTENSSVDNKDALPSVEIPDEKSVEEDLDVLRKKFVGEIDLPECKSHHYS